MTKIENELQAAIYTKNSTERHIEQPVKIDLSARFVLVIFFFVIIATITSFFLKIDVITSSRGEFIYHSDPEMLQHLEGGRVEKILVQEGQTVYKGQLIAELNAIERGSELNSLTSQLKALSGEIISLKALTENSTPFYDLTAFSIEEAEEWMALWKKNLNAHNAQLQLIAHDLDAKKTLTTSMQQRRASAGQQLQVIKEQLEIKQKLYNEEMASYLDVLQVQVQELNMLREIENLDEAIMNETLLIERLAMQQQSLEADFQQQNAERLQKLESDYQLKLTQLPSYQDKVNRLQILAPIDGVVDQINFNYLSAVVQPGESIGSITALDNPLIAETKIPAKDIGFIEIGQRVKLKVDTFPFAKFGSVNGTIKSISISSFEEDKKQVYIARINLDKQYLNFRGQRFRLRSNMEFTADILTGQQTILQYAIKPIVSAVDGAFDER